MCCCLMLYRYTTYTLLMINIMNKDDIFQVLIIILLLLKNEYIYLRCFVSKDVHSCVRVHELEYNLNISFSILTIVCLCKSSIFNTYFILWQTDHNEFSPNRVSSSVSTSDPAERSPELTSSTVSTYFPESHHWGLGGGYCFCLATRSGFAHSA